MLKWKLGRVHNSQTSRREWRVLPFPPSMGPFFQRSSLLGQESITTRMNWDLGQKNWLCLWLLWLWDSAFSVFEFCWFFVLFCCFSNRKCNFVKAFGCRENFFVEAFGWWENVAKWRKSLLKVNFITIKKYQNHFNLAKIAWIWTFFCGGFWLIWIFGSSCRWLLLAC